jgi:hypothetical protein
MNKNIAAEIDVSEITVKVHRRGLMTKMGATTFADLARMADALGLHLQAKPFGACRPFLPKLHSAGRDLWFNRAGPPGTVDGEAGYLARPSSKSGRNL